MVLKDLFESYLGLAGMSTPDKIWSLKKANEGIIYTP